MLSMIYGFIQNKFLIMSLNKTIARILMHNKIVYSCCEQEMFSAIFVNTGYEKLATKGIECYKLARARLHVRFDQ